MIEMMVRWLGFPPDASQHGPALDRMTAVVHWMMLLLFVGWGLFMLYVLVRFRAGRQPQAVYTGAKGSVAKGSEIAVIAAEVLLLVLFAFPTWATWIRLPAADEHPLEVRVIAEQFAWNVHYPGPDGVFGKTAVQLVNSNNPVGLDKADPAALDDITAINQLHVEIDRPVIVHLSSKDVIHSFGLPVMRVKQDAIPGLEIPIHFRPVKTSPEYPGCAGQKDCWEIACAQLCGLGHFRMRGFLNVDTAEQFRAWMAQQTPAVGGS
jgi:cytochrome c oxidase subunit 2